MTTASQPNAQSTDDREEWAASPPAHPPTVRRNLWRLYAILCLIPLAIFVNLVIGPHAQEPFEPLMAVDFGAFYAAATMVRDGDAGDLGKMEAQRAAQAAVQADAGTGWRWYNAFPYPPVTSLFTAPLAAFSLVTAFWIWAALGIFAATLASWFLARAYVPTIVWPATLILVSFEPIWDVAWWGQIDSLILFPVAVGIALLRSGSGPAGPSRNRRELIAGALFGVLAIKPIFVVLPLIVLAWGRPRAAVGMVLSGLALAAVSVALVGIGGIADYLELARFYQAFSGSPAVVEWRMYNLRGAAIRLDWAWPEGAQLAAVLTLSAILALTTAVLSARALRRHRDADVAAAAVILATVLTSYHVHVQSLVFLIIPLAIWLRRSLVSPTHFQSLLWAIPILAIHGGSALLRPQQPSPGPSETRLETLITTACVVALICILASLAGADRRHRRSAII